MDRNSTSFGAALRAHFAKLKHDPESDPLKYMQWFVLKYIELIKSGTVKNAPQGIILNYEMGLGKTIIALSIAQFLQSHGMKTMIIGPKALSDNFEVNRQKLSKMQGEPILMKDGQLNMVYYTARANNLAEQIRRNEFGDGKTAPPITRGTTLTDAFSNKVLIFEEYHLIANSIAHGRDVAGEIYRAAMNAKNCFKIMMTGTLIINSPFEAVPGINLAYGQAYMPEDKQQFDALFGTHERLMANKSRLQNAVSGLIAYMPVDKSDESFPTIAKNVILTAYMSPEQEARYNEMRETERKEGMNQGGGGGKKDNFMRSFGAEDSASSSYRVRSRIASNGANKWKIIADMIAQNEGRLFCVHCQFVEKGGVNDFANYIAGTMDFKELVIDANGVVIQGPADILGDKFVYDDGAGKKWNDLHPPPLYREKYYYRLTGETTNPKILKTLVQVLTDVRNRFGSFCQVLIMSSVGTTGLDLRYGQFIFYTSPFFHLEEFNQLRSRYYRYGASSLMPPDQRLIRTYILIAKPTPGVDDANNPIKSTEPSTDEHLFMIGLDKLKANHTFLDICRSVSIECLAGVAPYMDKCRTCVADDYPLVYKTLVTDMRLPDNCKCAERVEIDEAGAIHNAFIVKRAGDLTSYDIYIEDLNGGRQVKIGPEHHLYSIIKDRLVDNDGDK